MPLRADFPELSCFTLKLHPIQEPFQCSWDTNPCHRSYHRPRMSIKKLHYILLLLLFFKKKGSFWLLVSMWHSIARKPSRLALPIVAVTGICHRPVKESPLRTTLTAAVSSEIRISVFPPANAIVMLLPAKRVDAGPATSQTDFFSFFSNSALCFQLLHRRSLFIFQRLLTVHFWSGGVWARVSWRQ